nr:hypothetical protein [Mycoplasma struthionis]
MNLSKLNKYHNQFFDNSSFIIFSPFSSRYGFLPPKPKKPSSLSKPSADVGLLAYKNALFSLLI